MKTKVCTKCKLPKELDEFHKSVRFKTGYVSACKLCESSRKKITNSSNTEIRKNKYDNNRENVLQQRHIYYMNNKEEFSRKGKIYYNNNKDKSLEYGWKQKGIHNQDGTFYRLENHKTALENCNNSCEICGLSTTFHKKGLVVDHNHNTGIFRGILCGFCNTALAYFKDNSDNLRKAIEYLKK